MSSRRTYRGRRVAIAGGAALVLALGLYLPITLLAPLADAQEIVTTTALAPEKAAAPVWPQFGASAFSAVGYDGIMQTGGSNEPAPIASISKIVMALVVLQAKPLAVGDEGPTITFSQSDHDLYARYLALQGTVAPMPAGGSMTEHQALQVALIASANNYAAMLADWAFGSESGYLTAAKTWLSAHGLTHTTLVEPTGIDPSNVSTATDLVTLGKLALADPVVAPIVDTPSITLPIVGDIKDTNRLLGQQGIIGIKTGTLGDSSSLLFASRYPIGGHMVVIVGAVIGAPDRESLYPAVTALLDSVKAGFHSVTVATKGQALAQYVTRWGQSASAVAAVTTTTVVWSDDALSSRVKGVSIHFAAKGTAAGAASFAAGGITVRVPLRLGASLGDPGPWWRIANPALAFGRR